MPDTAHRAKSAFALDFTLREILRSSLDPQFVLVTFWSQQCYELMAEHWHIFLRKVRKHMTDLYGLRVFEFTQNSGLHIHCVWSCEVDDWLLEECAEGTLIGWCKQRRVWGGDLAGYLNKELRKQFDEEDAIKRRWNSFGSFANTCCKDVVAFGPEVDCAREAWGLREKGQKREDVEQMAKMMLRQWIETNPDGEGGEYSEDINERECIRASASGSDFPGSAGEEDGVPF
jgi:hypothetical protein